MKMQRTLGIPHHLQWSKEFTFWINTLNVTNVAKPLTELQSLFNISAHTADWNPTSVMCVRGPSGFFHPLLHIRDFMLARDQIWLSIKEFLHKRNSLSVHFVEGPFSEKIQHQKTHTRKKYYTCNHCRKDFNPYSVSLTSKSSYWRETLQM